MDATAEDGSWLEIQGSRAVERTAAETKLA
jgi:hypothetical protein